MVLFETLYFFILRETTPEILGPWDESEFTAAMGTILLNFFKIFYIFYNKFFLCFSHSTQG